MEKKEILDIFYNYIIPEAYTGRVNCYFIYNVCFYTRIPQRNLELVSEGAAKDNLMIPTLYITNCEMFEHLLVEYVEKALKFYDDSNFREEILTGNDIEEGKGISKEKIIMTLLWSNATVEDFHNPCLFLKKRINFFELGNLAEYTNFQIIGYSDILGVDIGVIMKKSRIESETPYYLQTFLLDSGSEEIIYEFPRTYFGISEGIANIYAIQNGKNRLINEKYNKKLERKMYKVNDGVDVKEDTYEKYGIGNLKDVTPSFLVVANIMIGLLKNSNIQKLNVVSMLITRWNSKIITMDLKKNLLVKKNENIDEINDLINSYYKNNILLQVNLTDKFLRVFRRLGYHHSSIAIIGYPMEIDSNLSLFLHDQEDVCNNKLLEETFKIDKKDRNFKFGKT